LAGSLWRAAERSPGSGFTVARRVASLAFFGQALAEAEVGILSSVVCASALGWLVANVSTRLPERIRDSTLGVTVIPRPPRSDAARSQ